MPFDRRRRVRPVVIDRATGRAVSPTPFIGLGLVASSLFLYGASFFLKEAGGPLVPLWAATVLFGTWLVMAVLCLRWWTSRPRWALAVGVASFVWWFLAVVLGAVILAWG
ncbi:MAG: hypothetical protein L0H31_09800 [Nocardioidaceae bacterium]|nr:hypothetical protein [Nocardioidaceae bacterium]